MRRYFRRQERVILERLLGPKVRRGTRFDASRPGTKQVDPAQVFDAAGWGRQLLEIASSFLTDLFADTARDFTRIFRPAARAGIDPADDWQFNIRQPGVQTAIAARVNRIVGVNETTFDQITRAIEAGDRQGEGIRQIANRIRGVFSDASRLRARTIARTEVAGAYNEAQYWVALESDVGVKTWLAIHDHRTRHSHNVADGQTVLVEKTFMVGGYPAMYPGDPSLPAKEVINCRCVVIYEEASDAAADGSETEPEVPAPVDPLVDEATVLPPEVAAELTLADEVAAVRAELGENLGIPRLDDARWGRAGGRYNGVDADGDWLVMDPDQGLRALPGQRMLEVEARVREVGDKVNAEVWDRAHRAGMLRHDEWKDRMATIDDEVEAAAKAVAHGRARVANRVYREATNGEFGSMDDLDAAIRSGRLTPEREAELRDLRWSLRGPYEEAEIAWDASPEGRALNEAYQRKRGERHELGTSYASHERRYLTPARKEVFDELGIELGSGGVENPWNVHPGRGSRGVLRMYPDETKKPGKSKTRTAMERAADEYPTDWIEHSRNQGALTVGNTPDRGYHRWLGNGQSQIAVSNRDLPRITYVDENGFAKIMDEPDGLTTAMHELGHRFERIVEPIRPLEWAFVHRRSGMTPRPNSLSGIYPGHGYGSGEYAFPDHFNDAYTGKIYEGGPHGSWEVMSQGVETVWYRQNGPRPAIDSRTSSYMQESAAGRPDETWGDRDFENLIMGILVLVRP